MRGVAKKANMRLANVRKEVLKIFGLAYMKLMMNFMPLLISTLIGHMILFIIKLVMNLKG
jgi:GTP cyclohydrolase II